MMPLHLSPLVADPAQSRAGTNSVLSESNGMVTDLLLHDTIVTDPFVLISYRERTETSQVFHAETCREDRDALSFKSLSTVWTMVIPSRSRLLVGSSRSNNSGRSMRT